MEGMTPSSLVYLLKYAKKTRGRYESVRVESSGVLSALDTL